MRPIEELSQLVGIPFEGVPLLHTALTHKSSVPDSLLASNERLEFLGDAVLGLIIAELMCERFPNKREGELAKARAQLVCRPSLARVGKAIQLNEYIQLGPAELANGSRSQDSIIADALEAVIGALYLSAGLSATRLFVSEQFGSSFASLAALSDWRDPKTRLQEVLHAASSTTPSYRVKAESGPAHERQFVVEVVIDGEVVGEGKGRTKREAESLAADAALKTMSPNKRALNRQRFDK